MTFALNVEILIQMSIKKNFKVDDFTINVENIIKKFKNKNVTCLIFDFGSFCEKKKLAYRIVSYDYILFF